MNRNITAVVGAVLSSGLICGWGVISAYAVELPEICETLGIDGESSKPMRTVTLPPSGTCAPKESRGFQIPDPNCSPGAINPTLTLDVLKTKGFTTKCVRDQATTPKQKQITYKWYDIQKPKKNSGQNQKCELDHIISLELGGADTLDNLWPQCGPSGAKLNSRFFKQKDTVENFLAREVRAGRISLSDAQNRIAEDWTQFLDAAKPKKKPK